MDYRIAGLGRQIKGWEKKASSHAIFKSGTIVLQKIADLFYQDMSRDNIISG
jgi:hypothetical protein